MGGAGALANIKAHADRDWWPRGNPSRCLMPVGCGTKHLGAAKCLACAAKRLALEHLAGGKALAHDQTPSLSTRVSEVVHCLLWCAQSKVNRIILELLKKDPLNESGGGPHSNFQF